MEKLKIIKENVINAYKNADINGKKLLIDLFGEETLNVKMNITDRIKTFDDVLNYFGTSEDDFTESCEELERDEIAYRKVKLIVSALNEGWTPDWSDSNENKYFPWFKMGSPSGAGFAYDDCDYWDSDSIVGSRLCFKSSELAKYAGTQFNDIYKEFFTL